VNFPQRRSRFAAFERHTHSIGVLETTVEPNKARFSRLSIQNRVCNCVDVDSGERGIIEFKHERGGTQRCGDVTDDAALTSLMICCGFIVCWSPSGIYDLLMLVGYITDVSGWYYNIMMMLGLTNSCVNPFIYAAKYREFQTGVRRLLRIHVEPAAQPVVIHVAGRSMNAGRQSKSVTGHSAQ